MKSQQDRIGDALWYLANLSNHFGIDLEESINENIQKVRDLYSANEKRNSESKLPLEQLPREFSLAFISMSPEDIALIIKLQNSEPMQIGDTINDNSHTADYYRFHDVFHLVYLFHLQWSPVMRALFRRKRKSNVETDTVEDGARAGILEEAISAAVFERAKKSRNFFEGNDTVDFELLDLIKGLTRGLEVSNRHHTEWEQAILDGYKQFRELKKNRGGIIVVSSANSELKYKHLEDDVEIHNIQKHYAENYPVEFDKKLNGEALNKLKAKNSGNTN